MLLDPVNNYINSGMVLEMGEGGWSGVVVGGGGGLELAGYSN